MEALSDIAAALEQSLRTRRQVFGPSHRRASREILNVLQAAPAPSPPPLPAPAPAEPADLAGRSAKLAAIEAEVRVCRQCPHLAESRTRTVFGFGNPGASLMLIGEAPGAEEDRQGEPFVGPAGELLTKILGAMGLARDDIYLANILKCRPDMPPGAPGNRPPAPAEMAQCLPYLRRQIAIVQPRVLVALGKTAVTGLLGTGPEVTMGSLRGRWHDFEGTPLMATYHPSYLLRNGALGEKRKVWEDMMAVMERLGMEISEKQRGFFLRG